MLTKTEYKAVRKQIAAYWTTLDLDTIKQEYLKKGLITQNAKLAKGINYNVGLELLASVLAPNLNICEAAGDCRYSCLVFAGQGNILHGRKLIDNGELTNPLKAKTRRTYFFKSDRTAFEFMLFDEITKHAEKAADSGKKFGVRLNTTSDIDWSHFASRMKHINFYDYTKVWYRKPSKNYYITYSASENTSKEDIKEKLLAGNNVAMVFNKLPETWEGFPVVNGDIDDNRYDDTKGVIIGLVTKATVGGSKGKQSTFLS